MVELVTSETMRRREQIACERYGINTLLLMENAGRGVALEVLEILRLNPSLKEVCIVCGSGNNGGDGMVVARHLVVSCPEKVPLVYLLGSPEYLKGDARYNYEVLIKLGIPSKVVTTPEDFVIPERALVVDAIFGTGLSKEVVGLHREIIRKINAIEDAFVMALDVPSGVDASDGRILGEAVRAHTTVTLGMVKRGLVLYPARDYVGRLRVVPIGIPLNETMEDCPVDGYLLSSEIRRFLPQRPWFAHKISAGVVGVLCGSSAMLGAGMLVALGAYRSGAGMVVWPLPFELSGVVRIRIPEIVSIELSGKGVNWSYSSEHLEDILLGLSARKCSSVVIGPGLGFNSATREFVKGFLEVSPFRGVLDADALNVIAEDRGKWEKKLSGWVITPHAGEMARLLGWSVQEVNEYKIRAVCEAARFFDCIAVLKGPGTIVADPEGKVFVNPTGNALLATAGSGDVLAGVIGGFLAQGLAPLWGSLCGVFLHGLAGDLLKEEGKRSVLAWEIAECIDAARKVVEDGKWKFPLLDGSF